MGGGRCLTVPEVRRWRWALVRVRVLCMGGAVWAIGMLQSCGSARDCVGVLSVYVLSVEDLGVCGHPYALREGSFPEDREYQWRYSAPDTRGMAFRVPHVMELDVCRPANPLQLMRKHSPAPLIVVFAGMHCLRRCKNRFGPITHRPDSRGWMPSTSPVADRRLDSCRRAAEPESKRAGTLGFQPFSLVRVGGVEPPRAYTHCHLKTARLPFRHTRRQSVNLPRPYGSVQARRVSRVARDIHTCDRAFPAVGDR